MSEKVVLKINGEDVSTNEYVTDVFLNVIKGLGLTLKGVGEIKKVEIECNYE